MVIQNITPLSSLPAISRNFPLFPEGSHPNRIQKIYFVHKIYVQIESLEL